MPSRETVVLTTESSDAEEDEEIDETEEVIMITEERKEESKAPTTLKAIEVTQSAGKPPSTCTDSDDSVEVVNVTSTPAVTKKKKNQNSGKTATATTPASGSTKKRGRKKKTAEDKATTPSTAANTSSTTPKKFTSPKKSPKTPNSSKQQPSIASFFSVSPKKKKNSSPVPPSSAKSFPSSVDKTKKKASDQNTPQKTPVTSTTKTTKRAPTSASSKSAKKNSKSPTKDDMMAIVLGAMISSTASTTSTTPLKTSPTPSSSQMHLPDIDGLSTFYEPSQTRKKSARRSKKNGSTSATKKKDSTAKKETSAKKKVQEKEKEPCASVKRKLDSELQQTEVEEPKRIEAMISPKRRKKNTPSAGESAAVVAVNNKAKNIVNVGNVVDGKDNEEEVQDVTMMMIDKENHQDKSPLKCNHHASEKCEDKPNGKGDSSLNSKKSAKKLNANVAATSAKESMVVCHGITDSTNSKTNETKGETNVTPKAKATTKSPVQNTIIFSLKKTAAATKAISISSPSKKNDKLSGNETGHPFSAVHSLNEMDESVKKMEKGKDNETKANKTSSPTKTAPAIQSPKENVGTPLANVPDEFKSILSKHSMLRKRYTKREEELVDRVVATGGAGFLDEELQERSDDIKNNCLKELEEQVRKAAGTSATSSSDEDRLPEHLVSSLATLVQGCELPLSTLANMALTKLSNCFNDCASTGVNLDTVTTKIKLFASRKQYLNPRKKSADVASPAGAVPTTKIDRFEDTDPRYMWRWELISLDLLPSSYAPPVKKARAARRKLQSQHKAVLRLLTSLDDAEKLFQLDNDDSVGGGAKKDISKRQDLRDSIFAKISNEEEKVLKYEREEEKIRLMNEAKAQKEKLKIQKQLEKQKERERTEEEKRKEKEKREEEKRKEKAQREEEREKKKQEAAKAREELKRKKEEERLSLKRKEQLEKEEKVKKQKARMLSFFSTSPSKEKTSPSSYTTCATDVGVGTSESSSSSLSESSNCVNQNNFDSDSFRSKINAYSSDDVDNKGDGNVDWNEKPPFQKLSSRAKLSRKRKTPVVSVSVHVTSLPESSGFFQQPYAEQRIIQVPNRYKFLYFREDCRPPYRGTWSKQSCIVTGRNPFGKDTTHLDYDVDSEAEWEEGDEDQGEDCDIDDLDEEEDKFDAEEGDTRVYNYDDGWLTKDDDLGLDNDEDDDEETIALRRRKLEAGNNGDGSADGTGSNGRNDQLAHQNVCVIAPLKGGLPIFKKEGCDSNCYSSLSSNENNQDALEGINPQDAMNLMKSHTGHVLRSSVTICLDAFPPSNTQNSDSKSKNAGTAESQGSSSVAKGSSSQEMSKEDMTTFAKFVHGCTLESKMKVIEELRTNHPNITSSRAQAMRKLDSIASKRRLANGGGVIWEVKKEVLESLGMEELLNLTATISTADSTATDAQHPQNTPTRAVSPGPETGTCNKAKDPENKLNKKRPIPGISKASANLFASFLVKKKRKISSK